MDENIHSSNEISLIRPRIPVIYGLVFDPDNDQLPVRLINQVAEHCTSIAPALQPSGSESHSGKTVEVINNEVSFLLTYFSRRWLFWTVKLPMFPFYFVLMFLLFLTSGSIPEGSRLHLATGVKLLWEITHKYLSYNKNSLLSNRF